MQFDAKRLAAVGALRREILHQRRHRLARIAAGQQHGAGARDVFERERQSAIEAERRGETLLAAGANAKTARSTGETALALAARSGSVATVKVLIAHGAEVDARSTVREWKRKVSGEPRPKELPQGGLTPLMFAARTGCIELRPIRDMDAVRQRVGAAR